MRHSGGCHCGSIRIELETDRHPHEHVIGACQCSFCRKHNARAFSDPKAFVTLTAHEPEHLQRYEFGLKTSEQVLCRRCGVYVAMVLSDADGVLSVVNVDAFDDRALFIREPESRDFDAEDRRSRIDRRKARWTPTILVGWPKGVYPLSDPLGEEEQQTTPAYLTSSAWKNYETAGFA
jgi:hypothetical protein